MTASRTDLPVHVSSVRAPGRGRRLVVRVAPVGRGRFENYTSYEQNQTRKRPQFGRRRSWRACFRDSRSSCAQRTRFCRKSKKSFSQIEANDRSIDRSIVVVVVVGGGGGRARAFGRVSRHHGVSLLPLPLAPISPHVSRSMPHAAHTSRAALFVAASSTRAR